MNLKNLIFFFSTILVILILPFVYKLPIPSDSIAGLYYPMRDVPFGYPNHVPVKNPLTTDPVRQQFAWKYLAVNQFKIGEWPLWNPYNFSGTPLLANFQSAVFYPLNLIFFTPNVYSNDPLQSFAIQWSWYIYAQIVFSFYFLYLYLRIIGLTRQASIFGGFVWAFSGFNVAWWQWGNVGHTVLWFPLMLYAVEKIINKPTVSIVDTSASRISKLNTIISLSLPEFILLAALTSSFLAGHLQSFMMCALNLWFYLL
ncbi:MAG: hypothetical protein M3P33_01335, partial [bacterium]|nr:hypothetical protein [bacterium]